MADTAQSPEELAANLESLLGQAKHIADGELDIYDSRLDEPEAEALLQFVELVKRWRLIDDENVAVEDWTTLGIITRLL